MKAIHDSVFSIQENVGLFHKKRKICNFIPRIRRVYRTEDGSTLLELEIQLRASVHERVVRFEKLASFDFESSVVGAICADDQGKPTQRLVVQYLRECLCENRAQQYSSLYITRGGWHEIAGTWCFVAGGTLLGQCGSNDVGLDPELKQRHLACGPEPLDTAESVEFLLRLFLQHSAVRIPTFAFTVVTALRSVLEQEGIPPVGVLYLDGPQGVGKTTVATDFCTLYDQNGRKADIFDASSSDSAILDALASTRDRIVLLDDICNESDAADKRKRLALAAHSVRMAVNDTQRGRRRGWKTEQVRCRAGLVITGEFPLRSASELTRCIRIPIMSRMTGRSASDRMRASASLAGYLSWFAEHMTAERARLRTEFDAFCRESAQRREERLQKSLWQLAWGFDSFLRFALEIRAIDSSCRDAMRELLDKILVDIFRETVALIEELWSSDLRNLAEVIATGIAKRQLSVTRRRGCVCVPLQTLMGYLQEVSAGKICNERQVTAALRQQDLLCMDQTGKSTCKVQGQRMLRIYENKLKARKNHEFCN